MSFEFSRRFKIGSRMVGEGEPVFIIAEAGVAHFGDPEKALRLVDLAVDAGADAVKFQVFRTNELISGAAPDWRERLGPRELAYEHFRNISAYCRERGIIFFATAHDEPSLDYLASLDPPVFKIGSGELDNWDFITRAARLGKPLIISTGMYDWDAVSALGEALAEAGNPDVAVLHCVTRYPTPAEEVNLRVMPELARRLGCVTGYSDHTEGYHIPLAAVALGARVLEKHISLDFNVPNAQDWKVSCGPHDLADMVSAVRGVQAALGGADKVLSAEEKASRDWARKSLHAACAIPAGTALTAEMLIARRPGTGLPPHMAAGLIGRRAGIDIPADEMLNLEMLD